MSREQFSSSEYFNIQIDEIKNIIERREEKLRLGLIKKEQVSTVSQSTFRFGIDILYSMYSAGYSKDEIKAYYAEVISLFNSPYNNWNEYEGEGVKSNIGDLLFLLSMAILLDEPVEVVESVISFIDTDKERYHILDYYISYFDKTRKITDTVKPYEGGFESLSKILDLPNEEIEQENLMGKYLKTWYSAKNKFYRVHMHATHNSGLDNYVGYWSFESAAFVKMRGLDDSSFRDSPYYPDDLLD